MTFFYHRQLHRLSWAGLIALLIGCDFERVKQQGPYIGARVDGKVASYDANSTAQSTGMNLVNRYFLSSKILRLYAYGEATASWTITLPTDIDRLPIPYTLRYDRDAISYTVTWRDETIQPMTDPRCGNPPGCSFEAGAQDDFTLTITKRTPTTIAGIFSGQMRLVGWGFVDKHKTVRVRNGKFSVVYDRREN